MRPAPIQPPLSCSHAIKLASDSRADGDGRRPPASSARHGLVRLRLRRQPGPACTTWGRPGLGAQSLWIPQYPSIVSTFASEPVAHRFSMRQEQQSPFAPVDPKWLQKLKRIRIVVRFRLPSLCLRCLVSSDSWIVANSARRSGLFET